MALARIHSAAFVGVDALKVEVEVDVKKSDTFSFVVVGLPDTVIRESKDRVLSALANSNYQTDCVRCCVSLAPADLKKEGCLYDLPIAVGFLAALSHIITKIHDDYLIVGELGLSGHTRPIRGALSVAMLAKQLGKKGVIVPHANAREAACVPGVEVIGVTHLSQALHFLNSPSSLAPWPPALSEGMLTEATAEVDFADVRGQYQAKRALEIAAAGGHNVLLSGPPGSGKSMLAKALIGIMPPLNVDEALDCTRIHSMASMLQEGKSLVTTRPFRSPHHTVSYAGLIGGGSTPRPGEVSLAHRGVLFLDELPEFAKATLEVLRQPLEDGKVTISRSNGSFTFPTRFVCIAAMNPCPCGYYTHPDRPCTCTETQVTKYRSRISGPLLDRLDMHITVQALRYEDFSSKVQSEKSAQIRQRVMTARSRQKSRQGAFANAELKSADLKSFCVLNDDGKEQMRRAIDQLGISARAHDRILRVARTIADLDDSDTIEKQHLCEAISFRGVGAAK